MKIMFVYKCYTLMFAASVLLSSVTQALDTTAPPTAPSALTVASTTSINVKSYREWKTAMVDTAELRVQKVKNSLEQQRQISGSKPDPNLNNLLSKEQLQATLASELTINDYFVGYLNKQTNLQQAIKGLAGKLNDEEVAELMSAYAYSFNKNNMKPLKSATESGSLGNLD
jgi:hypothetical protein